MTNQSPYNQLFQFNFRVSVTVGLASFLSSVILICGYFFAKKEYREVFNFAVATLAASAGITGTFYLAQSIKQSAEFQEDNRKVNLESQEAAIKKQVENQKIDRTLSYITRWNDPQYSSFRKTVEEISSLIKKKPHENREDIIKEYLETNTDGKQNITDILNLLEEMALCVNKELVKEEVLFEFYRYIVKAYCEIFGNFIISRRQEKASIKLYKYLTDLAEKWEAK